MRLAELQDELTDFDDARPRIGNGYLCLLRRPGLIPWGSAGYSSHAMPAVWREDDQGERTLAVAEAREFYGVRCVTLRSQVERYPGRIDVYRPLCDPEIRERAATIAFRQCGHAYGYAATAEAALLRMPLVRALLRYNPPRPTDPPARWIDAKNCSFHYAWCYERAIYELAHPTTWRPVFNMHARAIVPADLERSGSFRLVARGLTLEL